MNARGLACIIVVGALAAAGCGDDGSGGTNNDLAAPADQSMLPDQIMKALDGAPPDMGAPDLLAPPDLAPVPDLALAPDLLLVLDQAALPDLQLPPDLVPSPDLAVIPDLATPPDLSARPDLASPPDLLSPADLGGAKPDLVHVPQFYTVQVGPNGTLTFSPPNVDLQVGDSVLWFWLSSGHNVVSGKNGIADNTFCSPSDQNCPNAPTSNAGNTYLHQFNAAGTFAYFCAPHVGAGMTGTVTVK